LRRRERRGRIEWSCLQKHRSYTGYYGATSYRRLVEPFCSQCGFFAVHRCQMDVHHIDGNHENNDPANLTTLCANCHRLWHSQGEDGFAWAAVYRQRGLRYRLTTEDAA
jgi:5-methylcytosine-specific restriction endonuclease McrA